MSNCNPPLQLPCNSVRVLVSCYMQYAFVLRFIVATTYCNNNNKCVHLCFTYCIFVVFPLNSAHSASSVQKVKHDIPMNRYGKKLRLSAANRKGGEKNASNFVAGCAARVMHAIVASQMLRVPALREGQFFAIFRLCKRPRQRPLASTTTSISF